MNFFPCLKGSDVELQHYQVPRPNTSSVNLPSAPSTFIILMGNNSSYTSDINGYGCVYDVKNNTIISYLDTARALYISSVNGNTVNIVADQGAYRNIYYI